MNKYHRTRICFVAIFKHPTPNQAVVYFKIPCVPIISENHVRIKGTQF